MARIVNLLTEFVFGFIKLLRKENKIMKGKMKNLIVLLLSLLAFIFLSCSSGNGGGKDYYYDLTEGNIHDTDWHQPDIPGDDAPLCTPGGRRCAGAMAFEVCNSAGTGYDPGGVCESGTECYDGFCLDPCALADRKNESVGCVYYAVDTNAMQPGDYAVAISNVNQSRPANVIIETKEGGVWSPVAGGQFTVAPLTLTAKVLPHRFTSGSSIYKGGAYRITSDLPIIAYQFNPLDGSRSYLSDASLLLPKSSLDTYHFIEAWPQGPADDRTPEGYPAHIQIAAAADVVVTVTSSIPTRAGTGVPALTPGIPQAFNLEEGDFLQLDVAIHMDSFAGTYIESTGPVAVFSSNDCVNVPPDINWCCCEHLEEQIFGLQRWGKTYVGSRITPRGSEPAVWTIVASENNTTITFDYDPSVTGLPITVTMNRGERQQFQTQGPPDQPGDFYVSADKPILLTQYMVGAFMVSYGGNNGDPSMVQEVPTDQFLNRYVVLVPTTWQNDFLIITRKAGSNITIDNIQPSASWSAVGRSGWEVARIPVADGIHVLEGNQPFGVIVVGFDEFDSYAYPGGLNMQVINPII